MLAIGGRSSERPACAATMAAHYGGKGAALSELTLKVSERAEVTNIVGPPRRAKEMIKRERNASIVCKEMFSENQIKYITIALLT